MRALRFAAAAVATAIGCLALTPVTRDGGRRRGPGPPGDDLGEHDPHRRPRAGRDDAARDQRRPDHARGGQQRRRHVPRERPDRQVASPSTLYAKVRIPVTVADVVADGTIGLTDHAPRARRSRTCAAPPPGAATLPQDRARLPRHGDRADHPGELLPAVHRTACDVLIADDADDDLLEAGLAAVAALASRYPEGTDITLAPASDGPDAAAVATERIVVLAEGRAGEIATDIATAPGGVARPSPSPRPATTCPRPPARWRSPRAATRSQLADDPDVEGLTGQLGQREPDLELTLADAGVTDVVALRLRHHVPAREAPAGRLLLARSRRSRCTSRARTAP